MFKSLFDRVINQEYGRFVIIILLVALALGIILSVTYRLIKRRKTLTKGINLTLIVLPSVVALLVAVVNIRATEMSLIGLETGLVLAGIFAITRYRSDPLNTEDLTYIVLAFFIGVSSGLGYVAYAVIGTLAAVVAITVVYFTNFGQHATREKRLRFVVPEDLNYEEVFEEIFTRHLVYFVLERVKTVDFGQLYELTYTVKLKKTTSDKALIDEIRAKNANLEVMLSSLQSVQ